MSEIFVGDQMKNSLFLGYCDTESDIRKYWKTTWGNMNYHYLFLKTILSYFTTVISFYISIYDALRPFPPK